MKNLHKIKAGLPDEIKIFIARFCEYNGTPQAIAWRASEKDNFWYWYGGNPKLPIYPKSTGWGCISIADCYYYPQQTLFDFETKYKKHIKIYGESEFVG